MKRFVLYTLILFLFFLNSCENNENNENNENICLLKKIIESNLIKKNVGEYFYIDSRSKNILIYENVENEKILFDLNNETLIAVFKNSKEISLSDERKDSVINFISSTKKIMDSLKIHSIFPDKKKFAIETIISDSKKGEENYLGLISFHNSNLNDSLVEKYIKEFGLIRLDTVNSWYYYKYKKSN